ncbi:MAG TPA: hypothetical protein VF466_01215 [Candidatus Saccharimonadales bacterium]
MNEGVPGPANPNQPQDPLAAQIEGIFTPEDHAALGANDANALRNEVESAFPPDAERAMELNDSLNELPKPRAENAGIFADEIMRSKPDILNDDINSAVQRILNGETPTPPEEPAALTQEQLDAAAAENQRAENERRLGEAADEATGMSALGAAVDEATSLTPAPTLVPSRSAARRDLSGLGFAQVRDEYRRQSEQRRNERGQGLTPDQAAEALRDQQPPQDEGPDQGPQGEQQ